MTDVSWRSALTDTVSSGNRVYAGILLRDCMSRPATG
jgi:hypothetical protein